MKQKNKGSLYESSATSIKRNRSFKAQNVHSEYHSYQNIDQFSRKKNQYDSIASNPNEKLSNQLIKQLESEYENISNYVVHEDVSNNKNKRKTQQKGFKQQNFDINPYTKDSKLKNIYELHENQQRQQQPESFRHIQKVHTLQDQDDEQMQSPYHPKSQHNYNTQTFKKQKQRKYVKNMQINSQNNKPPNIPQLFHEKYVPQPNITHMKQKKSEYIKKNYHEGSEKIHQQFHRNETRDVTKKQSSHGKTKSIANSQSHHPIFRDTLEYVDATKYDFSGRLTEYSRRSGSSESGAQTNIQAKQSYRFKYKKYKHKYYNTVQVIKQLQSLNETLIHDQRQNYNYYQDTIKSLEDLLVTKDRQIQELHDHLQIYQNEERNRNLCSIEGRQNEILENENLRLKRELENKNSQINNLKTQINTISNIKQTDESFNPNEASKVTKNLQKKVNFLNTEKENFKKKIKALEQINQIYQKKLREKQKRISKLSSFNSQLQEQVLKLKGNFHSQLTNDTEKSQFKIPFLKRESKQISTQSIPVGNKQKKNAEIERHLACIDQQLRIIKNQIFVKLQEKEQKSPQSPYIKLLNPRKNIEFIKQNDGETSDSKQKTQQNYLLQLKALVQKLSHFREQFDLS